MRFKPIGTVLSGLCVCQSRHLDIVVGSAGVEPTSERGDRVQGYNLLPLPLGQLPKLNELSKIKSEKLAESERLERSCPKGEHWFSGPVGLPAAPALRGELPIK